MLLLTLFVGFFLAVYSKGKGYSPYAWVLGGAFFGYGVMALLPDVSKVMGREKEGSEAKRRFGNYLGIFLSVLTVLFDLGIVIFFIGAPNSPVH